VRAAASTDAPAALLLLLPPLLLLLLLLLPPLLLLLLLLLLVLLVGRLGWTSFGAEMPTCKRGAWCGMTCVACHRATPLRRHADGAGACTCCTDMFQQEGALKPCPRLQACALIMSSINISKP
jgi:hypothetical protein